jgi:triosephosphate isomerase
MSSRRPLVAGNWKMNGLRASLAEIAAIGRGYDGALKARADLLVCPPATLLAAAAAEASGSGVAVGAQDCHGSANGAHTGDIAAEMIADAGATYVIVGHSERRVDHGETSEAVRRKAEAAFRAGLTAVVCIGETEAERKAGRTLAVLGAQIDGSVPPSADAARLALAYEPVWAIGTGLTPTSADVAEAHAFIRERLERLLPGRSAGVRILYGGSVKPGNAAELMGVANVDGALVGGASLKAEDFLAIAAVYR